MNRQVTLQLALIFTVILLAATAGSREHWPVKGADSPLSAQTAGDNTVKSSSDDLPVELDAGVVNLEIQSLSAPDTLRQGDDLRSVVSLSLVNTGVDSLVNVFYCRFYLSDDDLIDSDDYSISRITIRDTIPPGAIIDVDLSDDTSLTVSLFANEGNRFLGIIADSRNDITETDESDNTASVPVTITTIPRTTVHYDDFQDGAAGWTSRDLTVQELHLYNTTYNDGSGDRGVWWCGEDIPSWPTAPGYGDNWDQWLTKEFTLGTGLIYLSCEVQYDTEPGYDYFLIEISADGGASFSELARYDGDSGGFIPIGPIDLSLYAGLDVLINFRFTSDGSWSDYDGLYDSNGAFRLDAVAITGQPIDDFETGGDGWIPSIAPPVGGEWRMEFEPECLEYPCDAYSNGNEAVTCNSWVAYDSELHFPASTQEQRDDGKSVHIVIESPLITIPTDASHVVFRYDLYSNMPMENGVYYFWEVYLPGTNIWTNDGFVYFGDYGWSRKTVDLTPFVLPGTSEIRLRLGARELGYLYEHNTFEHNSGPYFNNVEVIVTETADPGIDPEDFPRACGWASDDIDGDGVLDFEDLCVGESSAFFDRDGDGCLDPVRNTRHMEYWGADRLPLPYAIHQSGAPGIDDGSDFSAIQAGVNTWTTVPGTEVTVNYLGPTALADAQALDFQNLITFSDPDFVFPSGVLAVGISTSFTTPMPIGGGYRPGEIADVDMIFNPAASFRTATQGDGVDIQSTVTHEAGHWLGLAHSSVRSSTMFYVLQPGTGASFLTAEDENVLLRSYPSAATLVGASHLRGTVTDGVTDQPVPGAIVFAISEATGDTLANDYTIPFEGTYHFIGLPDGNYRVAIHPLNGASNIGFIEPINISELIYIHAEQVFEAEYWDAAESSTDDPTASTSVFVSAGTTVFADLVTNVDVQGPVIVATSPPVNGTDVAIDAAIAIRFDEAIDGDSLAGNFTLHEAGSSGLLPGNAALVEDGHTLTYITVQNFDFSTSYELSVGAGVRDLYGNTMTTPLDLTFTTHSRPPVSISNLAPRKGVAGSIVVINGEGFDPSPALNMILLNGSMLPASQASTTQLVFDIPANAVAGPVTIQVMNMAAGETSNSLTYTVLEPEEIARGVEIASVELFALPRTTGVSPAGDELYVATGNGLAVVDITDPGVPTLDTIDIENGLEDLVVTPDGQSIFAISQTNEMLYRFEKATSVLLLNELPVSDVPRGIAVDPSGRRAYVATDMNEIQIWDINEFSDTYEHPIGALDAQEHDLLGTLTTDPAGAYLLALASSGNLVVFDIEADTLRTAIPLLTNPRDIVVDPTGQRAYVTDVDGYVSIVSLTSFTKIIDITTGGSLRGGAITATGSFVYAANRELDNLDVIDLRTGSPTYLNIATRIPQRVNPLDVAFSPDGVYAFSLVEAERRLVITAKGAGPLLSALSPIAGPPGTRVVLSGSGFTGASVAYDGANIPVERSSDTALAVTIPGDAVDGRLTVLGAEAGQVSNSMSFAVLESGDAGALRLAATGSPPGLPPLSGAVAVSPDGNVVAIGSESGLVHLLDSDPNSPSFQQYIGQAGGFTTPVGSLAFDPSAEVVYAVSTTDPLAVAVIADPESPDIGTVDRTIAPGGTGLTGVAVSPDGTQLLIGDAGASVVYLVDLTAADAVTSISTAGAVANLDGPVADMVFHPAGAHAYLAIVDEDPATVLVLDMDRDSGTYGSIAGSILLPAGTPSEVPISLSFTPDGASCLVLTSQQGTTPGRSVVTLDTTTPEAPALGATVSIASTSAAMAEHIQVSPTGGRAILNTRTDGFHLLDLITLDVLNQADILPDDLPVGFGFSPDATRLYAASSDADAVYSFDFQAGQQIVSVWGDTQTGIVGQQLSSSLRVRIIDVESGDGSIGVPVTFNVTSGGGHFVTDDPGDAPTELIVGTDNFGYAQVGWILGPVAGVQEISAGAVGAVGSPLSLVATAITDPQTQPLVVVESLLAPLAGTTNVSVSTVVQVTFSRPVNPASITPTGFYLSADGGATTIPTVLGFVDENRKLSLTPIDELAYSTTHTIGILPSIVDTDGGLLQNSQQPTFVTEDLPLVPVLEAVAPPSAVATNQVVLSGHGFSDLATENEVYFNDLSAPVIEAGTDFLRTMVPIGAESGDIHVETNLQSSNTIPFTVLVPDEQPADDVIASAGTGSATRSVTVDPDGAIAYAVSPEADLVIPILLETLTTMPGIPVGDEPWAITIHPTGEFAYVANRLSGDVSVIDINAASDDWHDVVGSLEVGALPIDIIATPAGDRVIVANSGSNDLAVIDSDDLSASFHSVVARPATGSTARTVSVAPDGTRIYIGTDDGYIVLGSVDYGVVSRVPTGSTARSVTVSPDGTLLILIDTGGDIAIFNIVPGSSTEDQVVATVRVGSGAKSATVSPDGTLLFVITEEEDAILVFSLKLVASVGVIDPDASLPPTELTLVTTLYPGEDPQFIAFDPQGSGEFIVTNAGDNTVVKFGEFDLGDGSLTGRVFADCPVLETGLYGVEVGVYLGSSENLFVVLTTDSLGYYATDLEAGDYTVTMVPPLGYASAVEETLISVAGGPSALEWSLSCEEIVPSPRKMAFWKHQLCVAIRGWGWVVVDGPTLCGYLDLITSHFNNNSINQVSIYTPPESDECADKLAAGVNAFCGGWSQHARAKKQLMALMFNVAAGKIALSEVISADGKVVSQAITYVDNCIDDDDPGNDLQAMRIARRINWGRIVHAGLIPDDTPIISYLPAPHRFNLAQNQPNPFNPTCKIKFDIAKPVHVRLKIYDLAGRLVRTLIDEPYQPQRYMVIWNGRDDRGASVASGVYFCRLEAGEYLQTRKMMLLK